jgi:hypothetical protein
MTGRRTYLRRKADGAQIAGEMFRGSATIILEGGIGRDRLDPQIVEQTIEAAIEIGVDAREHAVEIGHDAQTFPNMKSSRTIVRSAYASVPEGFFLRRASMFVIWPAVCAEVCRPDAYSDRLSSIRADL